MHSKRHVLLGLALATALFAAGCGTAGGIAESRPPTTAQLRSQLLTLSDLPPGWTSLPASSASGGDGGGPCQVSGGMRTHASAQVSRRFSQGELRNFDEFIAGFARPPAQSFDHEVAQFNACHKVIIGGTPMTFGPMSFPHLGDSSAAFQGTGTLSGIPFGFDMVAVLTGNEVVVGLYVGAGSLPVNQVRELVGRAVAKAS